MGNFKQFSENIKGPITLLIVILALGTMINSAVLLVEDVATSYKGYSMYPTNKVFTLTLLAGSLLPTFAQMIFGYQAIDGKKNWFIWGGLSILFMGIDVYFDVLYKAQATGYVKAIAESLLYFWIGSEILFTVAFGIFIYNLGTARSELTKLKIAWSTAAPDPKLPHTSRSPGRIGAGRPARDPHTASRRMRPPPGPIGASRHIEEPEGMTLSPMFVGEDED